MQYKNKTPIPCTDYLNTLTIIVRSSMISKTIQIIIAINKMII